MIYKISIIIWNNNILNRDYQNTQKKKIHGQSNSDEVNSKIQAIMAFHSLNDEHRFSSGFPSNSNK